MDGAYSVHGRCEKSKDFVGEFIGKRPLRWLHVGWKIMLLQITIKVWVLT